MIKNSKRSYSSDGIKKSRKDYYLVMVDHHAEGVCTSFEVAQACAKCYANKYKAGEIEGEDVYIYEDSSGKHLISIERIKRIRMPYNLGDDE